MRMLWLSWLRLSLLNVSLWNLRNAGQSAEPEKPGDRNSHHSTPLWECYVSLPNRVNAAESSGNRYSGSGTQSGSPPNEW